MLAQVLRAEEQGMPGEVIEYRPVVVCDFCGKAQGEVEFLFAALGGLHHICDGCVENMAGTLMLVRVGRSNG